MPVPEHDRLRPLFVVPAERLADEIAFWRDVLGFEVEFSLPSDDGTGAYTTLRDGPVRVVLSTPRARSSVPVEPTTGALLLLETPDPVALRAVFARRLPPDLAPSLGPLQEDSGAVFFELCDPAGHRIWFIRYPE